MLPSPSFLIDCGSVSSFPSGVPSTTSSASPSSSFFMASASNSRSSSSTSSAAPPLLISSLRGQRNQNTFHATRYGRTMPHPRMDFANPNDQKRTSTQTRRYATKNRNAPTFSNMSTNPSGFRRAERRKDVTSLGMTMSSPFSSRIVRTLPRTSSVPSVRARCSAEARSLANSAASLRALTPSSRPFSASSDPLAASLFHAGAATSSYRGSTFSLQIGIACWFTCSARWAS
mmetsp:Transcript_38250/g.78050  ORF Transcript_38250/g.78050 Transcript_38250/m.78050 type:complete len:231 (-) Transcript_38250:1022-1714(-)